MAGLEAIIDATAGILAAQSLEATLQAMAEALAPIVPYTSLVVYEVAWTERICIPLLATGSYVEQTLGSRPPLDDSAPARPSSLASSSTAAPLTRCSAT